MTKKILTFLVSISMLLSCLTIYPLSAEAEQNGATYSGTATSWGYTENISLTILNIDTINSTFVGNYNMTGAYSHSQSISGPISCNIESGNAIFSISFSINFYNTSFELKINNTTGICIGTSSGYAHFENILLSGTPKSHVFSYSKSCNSPVESLYKECLQYSVDVYDSNFKNEYSASKCPEKLFDSFTDNEYKDIQASNFNDNDDTNVSYVIAHKPLENNTEKFFVAIRGTDGVEWEGNMKICPANNEGNYDKYTGNESIHNNFNTAAIKLRTKVDEYIKKYSKNSEVFLVITGHSRGGAVSNLLAYNYTTDETFDGVVTAYTFATPNVVQYNTKDDIEQYGNIYNYCKNKDFIPCIPLLDGKWNYWKFGKIFIESSSDNDVYSTKLTHIMSNDKHAPTVKAYYDRKFPYQNSDINISLYDFLQLTLSSSMEQSTDIVSKSRYAKNMLNWVGDNFKGLNTLSSQLRKDLLFIGFNHMPSLYRTLAIDDYSPYTYEDAKNRLGETININTLSKTSSIKSTSSITSYNEYEISKIQFFLSQCDNNNVKNYEKLQWNINDASTWDKIYFNSNGKITGIDLDFCDLYDKLDISSFTDLININISSNYISYIDISNCSNLQYLDASDNSLSALDVDNNTCLTYLDFSCNNIQNINLLNNSQLEYLYCNDCNLLSLNISNLNRLIEVNCENNEISELRTNNNLSLKELHCCLNYLDIQDTSTQMNNFNIMINNSSCNISYFPQKTSPNANFDSDEISYLKNLAINNTSLNWISDNKELNIESIQKNVLFEKINNKYRVTLIDISNIDISENLNLNSFAYLKELYCDNSNICGLNLYNCTSLEVISCKNCNISTFILPSNKDNSNLYYLDCEFNHINTASITETIINNIKSKENSVIDYKRQKADLSAYQATLDFIGKLVKSDYSIESFSDLSAQIALCNDYNLDYLTQSEADQITSNLLTEIYNLKAFLNAKISAKNGIVKVFYDETELEDNSLTNSGGVTELPPDTEGFTVSDGSDTFSVLFGTTVTLTATPKEGYNFVGWFDSSSNRHISTENPYTFRVAANVDVKAIFASDGDATLTFLTPSNQVITTISKFPAEWAEVGTINDLLPDVPFKYGCKNGRWEYNEADVLSKLRSGENVNIVSAYDKGEFTVPSPKKSEDKPALDLYYNYDDESGIGSFIMTTGFPENIKVESVGIAYYFKAADSFNPKDYILTLNNKVRTSKFGMDKLYDYYIMNMKNINDRNNWSVRGYVAYYDSDDNLQVEYSNQINIVNNIADRSAVSNENSATQLSPDEI